MVLQQPSHHIHTLKYAQSPHEVKKKGARGNQPQNSPILNKQYH